MALYRCGGGGTKVAKGTLTTSIRSTDHVINTGLSDINEFWMHGYTTGSDGYKHQHSLYYTKDDSSYYQVSNHIMPESNVGCAGREAIGTVYNRRGYSIKSIVGGVVTITTPSLSDAYASNNLNWTAY